MKTIVITGASRGIGLATAKRFLEEGWRVIGTFNKTKSQINSPNFTAIKLDLSSGDSIETACHEISTQTTTIEALINNAGIVVDGHDKSIDLAKVRQTLEIDLLAVMDFTNRLLPMLVKGSHIVNIDSQYGSFSFPIDYEGSTGYRLAKTALNMYSRILAYNLKDKGVVVSSLDPGWVKTDMGLSVADEFAGPDREPKEPANDIFQLVTTVEESGYFWRFGKKRDW